MQDYRKLLDLLDLPEDINITYVPDHPEYGEAVRADLPERLWQDRGFSAVEIGLRGDVRHVWKNMQEVLRNLH